MKYFIVSKDVINEIVKALNNNTISYDNQFRNDDIVEALKSINAEIEEQK